MEFKISVVIRTYNEQKHIREVLESLKNQTHKNYEIIIVDSESTDQTLKMVKDYDVNVIHILKKDFNYSYASNVGFQHSRGEIVCFLSGHSIPVKDTYLADTNEIFQSNKIGACYGDVIALPDGSLIEKLYHYLGYIKNRNKTQHVELEKKIHPGILSCSNASVRKSLLLKHPFKEALGNGGEDVEVAYRIIKDGYLIAKAPNLLVMHSHGSGVIKFLKELKSWRIMYNNVLEYILKNS